MGYTREHRQKAAALNAADARALLSKSLPLVLKMLTPAELEQVQKVMDAAVVNPVVKKEYEDAMRRSIVTDWAREGGNTEGVMLNGRMVTRNVDLARRAERLNQPIPVTATDYSIRLDHSKLLAADAFTPETDNPDEAAYLQKVKGILNGSGVWLRIGQPQVSAFVIDPRVFSVWLSVGRDGDSFFTIPTKDGQLTRDALLNTKTLGAGYARDVTRGYVLQELRSEMDRLERTINAGIMHHNILSSIRTQAFPGVNAVSDALGGASFPDESIWELPRKLLLKARYLLIGGNNITSTRGYFLAAAALTRSSAKLIAEYIDDVSSGAGMAVNMLNVAKTAGEVAEVGLAVTGVAGVVRGGTKVAAKGAMSEADVLLEKEIGKAVAKDPSLAAELRGISVAPGPKGTVLGRGIKPNQSNGAGTGWHKW